MRARHQTNWRSYSLESLVYGSPGTCQPPSTVASQKPNGFSGVPAPRSGASPLVYIIGVSLGGSYLRPASSISTFAPSIASV